MSKLSDYSSEISKIRRKFTSKGKSQISAQCGELLSKYGISESLNHSLLENNSAAQRLNKNRRKNDQKKTLDAKNVCESFAILSELEDPAELDLMMEGQKEKYKKQILGLMKAEDKKNKCTRTYKNDRTHMSRSIGMNSSSKLGLKTYTYSNGMEWNPMNPSSAWRKNKEFDNATTIPSSVFSQKALMNSPGIIRELENELGPVKGSIRLATTGEKLHDINVGISQLSKEVWKDEPLSQVYKITSQEKEKCNPNFEQLLPPYETLKIHPAEIVTLSNFGNIKLPVRSVLAMSQQASTEVEKDILEQEGSLEMKLLKAVNPYSQKLHHSEMPESKLFSKRRPGENLKTKMNMHDKERILFGTTVDKEINERSQKDMMDLRIFNTNFEKHFGVKLSGKVCLDNLSDSVITIETKENSKLIGKEFSELRRQLGWDTKTYSSEKSDEQEVDIYGNVMDQKSKTTEGVIDRLIENTTLYPCFDEVLFENTFRIRPDKNINHVSTITDHLGATSVLDSSELLLNIHKRQYTPPLAENFPKGLPSIVQDPRLIWQKEFVNIPYEVTADLIRKIQKGFWDEITNDVVKSSYGSISVSSLESISNIKKFILDDLGFNSMYNVDEPFDVSSPKLIPIEREQAQQRFGGGNKPPLYNSASNFGNGNKLILTPRLKGTLSASTLISSTFPKFEKEKKQAPQNQQKENSVNKKNISTIDYIPDCELYETALWNRYEFPNEDSNKGSIRKIKPGKSIIESDPLYSDNVISMSSEWQSQMEAQMRERREGVEILANSRNYMTSPEKSFLGKLNEIVEGGVEAMGKKEVGKLIELFKEPADTPEVLQKSSLSGTESKKSNKIEFKQFLGTVAKNLGGSNLGIFSQTTPNGKENPDSIKAKSQQNYIFKKLKYSQRTNKNGRGNGESQNEEYEDDDESSAIEEDSEEFEDLSSDNEEDYRLVCERITVRKWEPTNLLFTKNLFKSMKSIFVTLSTVISKDSKAKSRVEIYELGEHGIIVWMGRDPIGIKEKMISCFSDAKGKLRVKGGIYFTPNTEISPIEPCTEIPGNFVFTVTGVSLSHMILKKNVIKQLETFKKYVIDNDLGSSENKKEGGGEIGNLENSEGQNPEMGKGLVIRGNNQNNLKIGYSKNMENHPFSPQKYRFGVNVDTDMDIISRYDRSKIDNLEVTKLVPALNSNKISGQNTILVATEDPLLIGLLPLSVTDFPKITIRFSLRRNRLLLWRSIKCQIWKTQYLEYCFKSKIIPAKKVVSFISNAFSKLSSSNSFDLAGLEFQEEIFVHCINVALSRKEPKEIIFRGCYMGDEGFYAIFPLLRQIKKLGRLDLGMNNLTARSLPLVIEVVKSTSCRKLLLDFNNLGQNKSKRDFAIFFKHILFSTSLEQLNLSRNRINGRCIDFLDTFLDNSNSKNKSLETLYWCSNGNTQPEIETLLLVLQPLCSNLTKVYLGGNLIERIEAFKRRFSPVRIIMEDNTSSYLIKSNNSENGSLKNSGSSNPVSRIQIDSFSNSSIRFANSGLFS
ncbi:leucine-rich repeat-containing protein 45-like [Cryptosporidium felis]|nr:leucine-rich repeat-containing protein 45-like [Cryptosporidium felis]